MKSSQTLENRLENLESVVMHQQKLLDDLNEVMIDQSKLIIKLERKLKQMEMQWQDAQFASRDARDPLAEKPPHY